MNANSYKQLEERDDYIEELRKQLKEAKRDNELLMLNLTQCGQQLAASQAREQKLRSQILLMIDSWWPFVHGAFPSNTARSMFDKASESIQPPYDTSDLESLIQKAGEVMQERCSKVADWQAEGWTAAIEIRSIPSITLKDLK